MPGKEINKKLLLTMVYGYLFDFCILKKPSGNSHYENHFAPSYSIKSNKINYL